MHRISAVVTLPRWVCIFLVHIDWVHFVRSGEAQAAELSGVCLDIPS